MLPLHCVYFAAETVLPLDMPVLEQPCADSGRVYSAADCTDSERICSTTALAASGRVPVL